MNPDYTPRDRTYSSNDISEANATIKYYYNKMEGIATAEFSGAIQRETSEAIAEQLTSETLTSIEAICLDHQALGRAADELKYILSEELLRQDITDLRENHEWIASRGSDLAMAVTTFWLSLDKEASQRKKICGKLIQELTDNLDSSLTQKATLIFSRFYIDQPGMIRMLKHINAQQKIDMPIVDKGSFQSVYEEQFQSEVLASRSKQISHWHT